MLLLSRAEIRAVFPMDAAIDAAEESFRRWSAGEMVVPQRAAIPAHDVGGTFLFMPCYCAALLRRADGIGFDAWDAMRAEAGDLLQPMAAGLLPESALSGELGALLLGQGHGRQRADEILVFKSVGIGAQDLVAAKRIYDRAQATGLGTVWG